MVNNNVNKTHMTVKIPVGLLNEVDKIIEQKNLGFRSRNEFCVDCIRQIVRTYQNNHSNTNYQPFESGEERNQPGGKTNGSMAERTTPESNFKGLDVPQRKPHPTD